MIRYQLLALLCFCVPQAFAQGPSKDDTKLHEAMQQMFDAGIGPKRSASKATAAYEHAKRISSNDPRVTYAWGLIQYRRMKRDEGLKLLADAAKQGPATYFPARQATVWFLLSSKRTRQRALAEAETLAQELTQSPNAENQKQRLETAEWLSCLLYTSPSPRDRTRSRMPSSA